MTLTPATRFRTTTSCLQRTNKMLTTTPSTLITQALAANGAKVLYIVGRTGEKLDTGGEHKEDVARLADGIAARGECLCILVHNAGVSSETAQPESGSADEMRRNLFEHTDVVSLFFATAVFLPLLRRSAERHPHCGLVKSAQRHFADNAAAEGAADHLTRMLASEAAQGHKVRVNALALGVFPSVMTAGESERFQKSQLDKSAYEGKVPAGRPGRDIDMAQTVLAIALAFACNQYIHGQTLVVDGGYTLSLGQ
ncbi:uncharacterized protein P884DRAFT_280896 [Thermothelomyces heterothallicus CBS 202.75]|uniref:uncharacterized protein n=1 Tax=Thermothelomyces heterothallicus CBS 202.75 TaxID=1149848 RepID=UPI003742D252